MAHSSNVFLYGGMSPAPALRPLRAGPLTLFYEEGGLRTIRLGEREIVRRIYAAVRDHNWGTPPGRLSEERIESGEDHFRIEFLSHHREGGLDFSWQGLITGDAKGRIEFHFDGVAHTTFRRNRIGFCVLHPACECPGAALIVESSDRSIITTEFPQAIAAHNPHTDIRTLTHEVTPGLWCRVVFDGDAFEMEDQRNWIDASFKTFCTPLRLPFPVEIAAGTRLQQAVRLTLEGTLPEETVVSAMSSKFATTCSSRGHEAGFGRRQSSPPPNVGSYIQLPGAPAATDLAIDVGETPTHPLPALGLTLPAHETPWSKTQAARLRTLGLAHVRAEVTLGNTPWREPLASAIARARSLNLPLELALFLDHSTSRDLTDLSAYLDSRPVRVTRWLVFPKGDPGAVTAEAMETVRRALGPRTPGALFGSGTDTFFVFLNRSRPDAQALDFICYSLNPQVHASDHRSLVETLEAHVATVETARQFAGGKPIVVSPVTLRMRYNPAATAPEEPPAPGELPSQVDPRQLSLFGAAWTLGSIKYLAESGVAAATYFETTGWLGVMETAAGSPLPDRFPSAPGMVFPLYHVLADVGEFAGGQVMPLRSGDPLRIDGLALARADRRRVLLANMTAEPQSLRLRFPFAPAGALQRRRLHERNAHDAAHAPEDYRAAKNEQIDIVGDELRIELSPCEITRLDFVAPPQPVP